MTDHPNFKPGGLSEKLLRQLAERDYQPTAPRWATPRATLEREVRLRRELADAQAFIASGQLLKPLPTHAERLARIQSPDYCTSLRYQRQQWTCDDERQLAARHEDWPVLAFEGRFIRQLKLNSIPAFTAVWCERSIEVHHCYFLDRLDLGSWNIIATIGLDIAKRMRLKVSWGGNVRNDRCAQWQLDDHDITEDYRRDMDLLIQQKRDDKYRY